MNASKAPFHARKTQCVSTTLVVLCVNVKWDTVGLDLLVQVRLFKSWFKLWCCVDELSLEYL